MVRGAKSVMRNGLGTRFWTANWVDSGVCLLDLIKDGGLTPNLGVVVAEFIDTQGQWDFQKLSLYLPTQAVDLVIGMSPPRANLGEDSWVWGGEDSGWFSIKSAYRLICNQHKTTLVDPWKSICHWKGPNQTRLFLWLAL
ncbi:hypothetical protein LINPERHAP1_LOCUS15403 [Linum perenne]